MADSNNTEYRLRQRIITLEAELEAEREAHSRTMALLVSGEAMREKVMLQAILGGAYSAKPEDGSAV